MSDESLLQIRPKDSHSSLSFAGVKRSSLVARGRVDAAILTVPSAAEFETSLGVVFCDPDDIAVEDVYQGKALVDGLPGTPENHGEALDCFLRAAEQGNEIAQFNIGAMYTHGLGVEQDYIKAAEWYLKAAKQGEPGLAFLCGNILAQYNIGVMYQYGLGVERDYSLAARWYRRAADHGEDPPRFNPAAMYQEARAGEPDYAEAVRWYGRAIWGLPLAQFNLGLLYGAGVGVQRDYVLAHMWISFAARQHSDRTGSIGFVTLFCERSQEIAWVERSAAKYAAARDKITAKMNPAQLAESQCLERMLKKLAEKKARADDDFMAELKRKLEAHRSDSRADSPQG